MRTGMRFGDFCRGGGGEKRRGWSGVMERVDGSIREYEMVGVIASLCFVLVW